MSQHNHGVRCTKQPNCGCSRHCLCHQCIFFRRSYSLYSGLRSRLQEKKWKSGAREGTVRVPKRFLPFTIEQFRAWLRVILDETPWCTYCRERIDITNISPDHAVPDSRGGSLGLDNLRECCDDCNRTKGELLPGEFKALMEGLKSFTQDGRSDVLKRLRGGILHFGNKKKTAEAGAPAEPKATNVLAVPAKKMHPNKDLPF